MNTKYELRNEILLFANELRQSSEDQTRMVRIYLETEDPIHKEFHQTIIDIQNGKKPRPIEYNKPYWILYLAEGKKPRPDSDISIPLVELIKKLKLTDQEELLLDEIENKFSIANQLEFQAIALLDRSKNASFQRKKEIKSALYNQNFFRSKSNVMQSIQKFHSMVDERTKREITNLNNFEFFTLVLLGSLGICLFYFLFNSYLILDKTLGASLEQVQNKISKLGSGNFKPNSELKNVPVNSIMSWLLELKQKLISTEEKKHQAENKLLELNKDLEKKVEERTIELVRHIKKINKTEKELRMQSNLFQSFFLSSPTAISIYTVSDDRLIDVNPSFEKLFGYKKEEVIGKTSDELNIIFDKKTIQDGREKKNEDLLNQFEFTFQKKNKEIGYGIGNTSFAELNNSQIAISNIVDITEQKNIEFTLLESRNLMNAFLNSATESFTLYDSNLNLIEANPASLKWFKDKTKGEIIGKNMIELAPGIEGTERHQMYLNVMKTGVPLVLEWTAPMDKSLGNLFITIKAFRVNNGLGIIATDVTEKKLAEMELQKARDAADSANKAKSEFLASMSHEIRTPLNGVIGFTDLLLKSEMSEVQSQYLQIVSQSANSLMDLLNDILDFSKIEAGKLELSYERVDIIDLISQATDLVKFKAYEKKLELIISISPKIERFAVVDSVRLRQILVNLMGNAIKFTEQGEIEIILDKLSDIKEEGYSEIYFGVRDTGIGISEKNQKKIFEAFSQEDSTTTRKYGGTGLGITISNKLLEMMGSKLELESEVGKGSKFFFKLKLKTEIGEKETWEGIEQIHSVLIVDDNKNNRRALKDMLALQNINSIQAESANSALKELEKKSSFDLILTDYDMPDTNGLELVQKIISNELYKEIPIIVIHSSSDNEVIEKVSKAYGVKLTLQKPIKSKDLYKAITKIKKIDKSLGQIKNELNEKIDLSHTKILIVDDINTNRLLVKNILKSFSKDSQIIEAKNGQEAIHLFQNNSLDIIFMDVQMPEMNGYEATIEIRKLEKGNSRVPIIALTAGTVKAEIDECYESGMDDFAS
jgi:PAS domain S-box-containing protein